MPTLPSSSFSRELDAGLLIETTRQENIARPLEIGDCVQLLPRKEEQHPQQLAHVLRILNKQHVIQLKISGIIVRRKTAFLFCLTQTDPHVRPLAPDAFPPNFPAPDDYTPPAPIDTYPPSRKQGSWKQGSWSPSDLRYVIAPPANTAQVLPKPRIHQRKRRRAR